MTMASLILGPDKSSRSFSQTTVKYHCRMHLSQNWQQKSVYPLNTSPCQTNYYLPQTTASSSCSQEIANVNRLL